MRAILTWLAALASMLGLFFTIHSPSNALTKGQTFWLAVVIVAFLLAAAFDLKDELSRRVKKYRNEKSINKYMFKMLKRSGNSIIYTRDASWTKGEKIRQLLEEKSRANELTICMPKRTELCDHLEPIGAKIIEYSSLNMSPSVRFTIANAGRTSESFVAVGRKKDGRHVIEELDSSHPAFSMASDLIEVLRKINGL